MPLFTEYFCTTTVFIFFVESTSYVFSFWMMFFYLVTTGWIFYINQLMEESNQPINQSLLLLYYNRLDPFNDWGGGRGCNIFVPVLGGNGTKIAPTGDIFDQLHGQMR